MDITLYNNASEPNEINKALTQIDVVSAVIKGDISYEDPLIILSYAGEVTDDINYFKIPELNRCYFITDIKNLTGGRYQVQGRVDVLESFKNEILSLSAIVDKSNIVADVNMYLDDGSYIIENKEFNTVINFSTGFNEAGEYILITAGGGGGII